MEVKIPFRDSFRESMLCGTKTWTARRRRLAEPGDYFYAFGARFTVTQVVQRALREVANSYWREEGCDSPEHFTEVWVSLHPRTGFEPERLVYHH